jgi:hypothetical protein
MAGIMITNGGPHPMDKWAAETASNIAGLIQIDDASDSDAARVARRAKPRFELDLADVLELHHTRIQQAERAALKDVGSLRYDMPFAIGDDLMSAAVDDVAKAAVGTPFEEHFKEPQVQSVVRGIIGTHFASIMDIERQIHADNVIV